MKNFKWNSLHFPEHSEKVKEEQSQGNPWLNN